MPPSISQLSPGSFRVDYELVKARPSSVPAAALLLTTIMYNVLHIRIHSCTSPQPTFLTDTVITLEGKAVRSQLPSEGRVC